MLVLAFLLLQMYDVMVVVLVVLVLLFKVSGSV